MESQRPLSGIKVLELAGLAPSPFCGMILADFGADVVRIDRGNSADRLGRGKKSICVDLKKKEGVSVILRLVEKADVLIEPFRAGVMERLGLGPDVLLKQNPRLIFARLTGYGQDGPLAKTAGHDINYIAISGALSLFGRAGDKPLAPGNILADFAGGGLTCALGIVLALLERQRSGKGQVVDAAMIDGVSYLATFIHKAHYSGVWSGPRGTNLLDSGAPFYDTYKTKDGQYIAVGALEPQFYEELIEKLELKGRPDLPPQMDISKWNILRGILTERFAAKTREEWCRIFQGSDACVTPVLEIEELMRYPHHQARGFMVENKGEDGEATAVPAPRLSRTPAVTPQNVSPPSAGHSTAAVLLEYGFLDHEINRLALQGVISGGNRPRTAAL